MKKFLLAAAALLYTASVSADNFEVTTTDHLKVWAEFPEEIVADGKTVNYVKVFEHDDDDTLFCAFNMEFILPEGFQVNKVEDEDEELVDDIFLSKRARSSHSIACNIVDGVDLRIISTSMRNDEYRNADKNGNQMDELFTIGLIAQPTLAAGEYQVPMEGVKFSMKNADARVPANLPVYTIKVTNPDPNPTGIESVEASAIDPDDCYDLSGVKVDPAKVHGTVVVSKGRKVLVK